MILPIHVNGRCKLTEEAIREARSAGDDSYLYMHGTVLDGPFDIGSEYWFVRWDHAVMGRYEWACYLEAVQS